MRLALGDQDLIRLIQQIGITSTVFERKQIAWGLSKYISSACKIMALRSKSAETLKQIGMNGMEWNVETLKQIGMNGMEWQKTRFFFWNSSKYVGLPRINRACKTWF
jgi:hypothetical protein